MQENVQVASKPGSSYTADELQKTEVYQQLRKSYGGLPDSAVDGLARNIIQAMWDARREENVRELLADVFKRLQDLGFKSHTVLLSLDENKVQEKRQKTTRWSPSDYAELIGQTFTRNVVNSKFDDRNGEYKFRIEAPHPGHDVPFRCTLVQPNGMEVRFPPVNPAAIQETEAFKEVKSITNVMRESVLHHPQSPAMFFRIARPCDADEEQDSEE